MKTVVLRVVIKDDEEIQAVLTYRKIIYADDCIRNRTQSVYFDIIEKPTDKDIYKQAISYGITEITEFGNTYNHKSVNDFDNGSHWMRNKIWEAAE